MLLISQAVTSEEAKAAENDAKAKLLKYIETSDMEKMLFCEQIATRIKDAATMFKNADDSIQESTKTLQDIKARSE